MFDVINTYLIDVPQLEALVIDDKGEIGMSKPTTRDVAIAAKVSLATVDRVLNARSGVHQKTITKVNDAISQIGFTRNLSAANLARQKQYHFVFILPDREGQFISLIKEAVSEANHSLASERASVSTLLIPANDPHEIVRALRGLDIEKVDGVAIMASETPQVRDAISRLKSLGVSVVALVSNQPNSECDRFVGIDNFAAGRTAATLIGRFSGKQKGSILVVAESMQSRDSLERRLGFDSVIARDFPFLTVLPSMETHNDPNRADQIITMALANDPGILAVYMLSAEVQDVVKAIARTGAMSKLVILAHELTPFTRSALTARKIDAVITQDVGHLVRSSLRILRAKSDGLEAVASQERIRIEVILRENML